MQKSIAVQMLAPPSSLNATAAKEIYQKSLASCETDLRKELFGGEILVLELIDHKQLFLGCKYILKKMFIN